MSDKQAVKRMQIKQHNEAYDKMQAEEAISKVNIDLSKAMYNSTANDIPAEPHVETKELIETEKKLLSPQEYADAMGWNKIPRFPVNAKTYQVRKMFKQLTKQELQNEATSVRINHGVMKMEALLARAGV